MIIKHLLYVKHCVLCTNRTFNPCNKPLLDISYPTSWNSSCPLR
jgi:hypothetical protein